MNLRLVRRHFTDRATEGELRIDGEFCCYALEDVVRAPGVKVYGETAIPFGRYRIVLTYSPTFGRELPLLLDVPGFTHIRMHAGNHIGHTLGCILVGYDPTAPDDARIANSRPAENALVATLKPAIAAGPVFIEVVGPTLRENMRGPSEAVRVLQQWLRMGPRYENGVFGPLTDEAARAHQRACGLKADGIVGPKTWQTLRAA